MSDYDPRIDKPVYDDVAFEPRSPSRGLYLVVGVVAAIVAAAGLMFFSGDRPEGTELARKPGPGFHRHTDQRDADADRPARHTDPGTPSRNRSPGPASSRNGGSAWTKK